MTDIDEFFNLTSPTVTVNKPEIVDEVVEVKDSIELLISTALQKAETIKEQIVITISGEQFEIGNRVRMKENINRMKQSQLVEIIGVNKEGQIQIRSVYDHSKLFVSSDQLYFD